MKECPTCSGTGKLPYTVADLNAEVAKLGGSDEGWYTLAWGADHEVPGIGIANKVEYHDEEFETRCWLVVSIKDDTGNVRLFKRNGWRASHDDSYLDGPTVEVEKRTEMVEVTTYKPVTTTYEEL